MVNFLWKNFFKNNTPSVQEMLKNSYIFQDLTPKELKEISRLIHIRKYQPQEAIFKKGDIGMGIYIVGKGTVNIFLNPNTDQQPLVQLTEADYMGELSLIEEKSQRTATAIADHEVMLIGFFKPDLDQIIHNKPSLGIKIVIRIAESLARRVKETSFRMNKLKLEMKQHNL